MPGARPPPRSCYLPTHKIAPDGDEDGAYLPQHAVMTGYVARFGFAPGVGAATRESPRHNLTGDPYFTDGHRLVLFMDPEPRPVDQVELLVR